MFTQLFMKSKLIPHLIRSVRLIKERANWETWCSGKALRRSFRISNAISFQGTSGTIFLIIHNYFLPDPFKFISYHSTIWRRIVWILTASWNPPQEKIKMFEPILLFNKGNKLWYALFHNPDEVSGFFSWQPWGIASTRNEYQESSWV
jgi:hypothetical protein